MHRLMFGVLLLATLSVRAAEQPEIPKGMRVVTVHVQSTDREWATLATGKSIDVRLRGLNAEMEEFEQTLSGLKVFAVDDERFAKRRHVSLLATARDANLLKLAEEIGVVHIAVEPDADGTPADDADPLKPPAITTENVPPIPNDLVERLRQYNDVRTASFRGWSPDGKGMLIATRFGNTTQLHRVHEPGGRREQISFLDEPVSGRFVPKAEDGAIVLSASRGGDENDQLFALDRKTGRVARLTDGKSKNSLGPFRDDGSFVIVRSTQRNGKDFDLFVADPRRPGSMIPLLTTDGEYWAATDWSSDGNTLLLNRYVSINETYPALLSWRIIEREHPDDPTRTEVGIDVDERPIPIPGGGPAAFGTLKFGNDGRFVYASTDADGEFRQLVRIRTSDLAFEPLAPEVEWDVREIEVAPQQALKGVNLLAFTVNAGGPSDVYLLADDVDGVLRKRPRQAIVAGRAVVPGEPIKLTLPTGIVSGLEFSPDGKRLGFTLSPPNGPSDAYSLDLKSGKLERWTFSEVGGLDTSTFVTPELISYESFDGRQIPAFVFRPPIAAPDAPVPVVVGIHGGPESQYRPYLSGTDQFYLNELGFAVVRPNVRGSAGYGKSYLKLDNGPLREDSVKDIGALLDWIEKQPELDASRVAVVGGSYGGYMVLASLTHFPDRLEAGVDYVGIASFRTFLENTKAYRRDLRRAEYGDERDPKMAAVFEKIDPLNNVAKIKSALFVGHGVNDPRVPFSEAEQIVAAAKKNGLEPWTVYAADEGHGFRKQVNREYLSAATALFLWEHLKPEPEQRPNE